MVALVTLADLDRARQEFLAGAAGAGDEEGVGRVLANSVCLSVVSSIILSALAYWAAPSLISARAAAAFASTTSSPLQLPPVSIFSVLQSAHRCAPRFKLASSP